MNIPQKCLEIHTLDGQSKLKFGHLFVVGSDPIQNILEHQQYLGNDFVKGAENWEKFGFSAAATSARPSLYSLARSPLNTVSEQDATDTLTCYAAAIWQGYPINALITVSWEKAGIPGDPLKSHQAVIDAFYQFLYRNGIPAIYFWVRENGRRYGEHTHLAFHIPKYLRGKVRTVVCEAIKRLGGSPRKTGVRGIVKLSRDHFVSQRPVATTYPLIEYLLKGTDKETAAKFGLISNLGKAGQVAGKRIGQSKEIRRIAKEASERHEKAAQAILDAAGAKTSTHASADSKTGYKRVLSYFENDKRRAFTGISLVEGFEVMTGKLISQRKAASYLNAVGPNFSARGGKWTPKSYRNAKSEYEQYQLNEIQSAFESGVLISRIMGKIP